MEDNKMKLFSLFSGCGGLDVGFTGIEKNGVGDVARGEGFIHVFANDIYPPSCDSHSFNFNNELLKDSSNIWDEDGTIFCGDIRQVDFQKSSETPDVVIGGFPCQDFSLARGSENNGGRKGIKVKRGKLYCQFVRALSELQPPLFLAENVKGIVSANKGFAYKTILEDFRNLNERWGDVKQEYNEGREYKNGKNPTGYHIPFSEVVDFSKIGVPQKRERLIIIGIRKDIQRKLNINGDLKKIKRLLSKGRPVISKWPLTPLEVFEGKPLGELQCEYEQIMKEYKETINNPETDYQERYREEKWSEYTFDIWEDYLWINMGRSNVLDYPKKEINKKHKEVLKKLGYLNKPLKSAEFPDKSNKIMKEQERIQERMSYIPPNENYKFVEGTEHSVKGMMSNIYRRIHPIKPAYTVIARGGGGTWGYHYKRDRQRMTNRERARLQTFPDAFHFKGKNSEVRRQIGEAVPSLAGKIIAKELKKALLKIKKEKTATKN